MDFSAINTNAPRPIAAVYDDRPTPLAATPEASRPQTAEAVRQGEETSAVGDQPNRRATGELTEEERAVVDQLKARDREVRAHEQAHKTAGGPYAGAISYDFQRGPDGQNYAIGGSVPIDISPEGTPEETADKMRIVIRAALAPAEPSAADRQIAAAAQKQLLEAQAEMAANRAAEIRGEREELADESSSERSTLAPLAAYQASEADQPDTSIVITV